jgi:hypothetical protein
MVDQPRVVTQLSFQQAWREAVEILATEGWEVDNLVVQIADPKSLDSEFHDKMSAFCASHSLLSPKEVAYTIFPHRQYRIKGSAAEVFRAYNREGGLYERIRNRRQIRWGNYFRRMTHYQTSGGLVNQLQNIITAINERQRIWKAAYTILIQEPGSETIQPRGGPCLNYMAIQHRPTASNPVLGLLCVYRHHDFVERAYGNYWGLCNLTSFLAEETHSAPGPMTCVSSHAYVGRLKTSMRSLLERLE